MTLIPARRLVDWSNCGVTGGISQYLDGSGHANERATAAFLDATEAPYNADRTGATDSTAAIQAAINAAASGVWLPVGLYKVSSILYLKSNITLRGAGMFYFSKTSVEVSTGNKTFTVQAGLPYVAGVGIIVEAVELPEQKTPVMSWDKHPHLIGTVVSYSGTELVVSVATVHGTGTYSRWRLSGTMLVAASGQPAGVYATTSLGNDFVASGDSHLIPSISSATTKGSDTLTVDLGSTGWAAPQAGDFCSIQYANENDPNLGHAEDSTVVWSSKDYPLIRRNTHKILTATPAGGTLYTLTIDPPLSATSAAGTARATWSSSFKTKVGMEDFSVWLYEAQFGALGAYMTGVSDSWMYRIGVLHPTSFHMGASAAWRLTTQGCWISHRRGSGPGGGGWIGGGTRLLIENNIFAQTDPVIEINGGCYHSVIAYNFMPGAAANINHGPHNSHNLWEGNALTWFISDGYFGGQSDETIFRNAMRGLDAPWEVFGGGVTLDRGAYNFNVVGNVMGRPAVGARGYFQLGMPNFGGPGTGTIVTPKTGSFWLHRNASGPTLLGTLTSRVSSNEAVITLTSMYTSALEAPAMHAGSVKAVSVRWGPWETSARHDMLVTVLTGSTFRVEGGQGIALPPEATAVYIVTGNVGMQETDGDVAGTLIDKGNYVVGEGGVGGSMSSLGGDTLPDSLYLPAKPSWFGHLDFPPFDPAAPDFGNSKIPAWHLYYELEHVGESLPEDPPPAAPSWPTPRSERSTRYPRTNLIP